MAGKYLVKKLTSPQNITLYRNGDNPNIYYYFTWNKKVYRGSTGASEKQSSIDRMNTIYYEITHGSREKRRKKVKFETAVKKFLKFKQTQKLSPNTLRVYKIHSKFLIEKLKERDINSFGSKSFYLEYINWRKNYYNTSHKSQQSYKRNGKAVKGRKYRNVGSVTLNRECRLLVSILRFSKDYLNVLKNVEIGSYEVIREKRREDILNKKEFLRLQEYWINKNPYYWMLISFVNETGIRYPSELNNISWKDVNLERSYVIIRNRKNRKRSEPNNTAVPLIRTGKEIIEILKQRENISKEENDPVFVNDKGVQVKDIRKSFKKGIEECGIKKNITMYTLRHLYTTRMVSRPDIPLKMIAYTLGHRDTTMLDKFYSHLRSEDVIQTFQRSEDRIKQIVKEEIKKGKLEKLFKIVDIPEG